MTRRTPLRRTGLLALLATFALLGSACGGDDESPSDDGAGPSAAAGESGEPIRIGLVTDLIGPFVTFGRDIEAATNLAIEQVNDAGGVNGSSLELEVMDTGGQPQEAVTAVRELADDDVFAISGPLSSGEAEVVFAQASQVGVPLVSGTANKDGITEIGQGWAFLNQATNSALFNEAIPAWMEEFDVATAALVFDEEEPVSAGAATGAIPGAAEAAGLEIVNADASITFVRGQTDFATVVQRIRETDADGLILMSAPAEAGLIAAELVRQGEDRPIIGHPSQASQAFFEGGGSQVSNWLLPLVFDRTGDDPEAQEFVASMTELNDQPPVAEAANYFDNILMLAEVMMAAGIDGSTSADEARTAIKDGLLALADFDGVAGTISFDGSNDAVKTIHLVVVQEGEPTPL